MEIRVHVTQLLAETSGTSKSGNAWNKKEFVGETYDQYPKKVCFTIFNNKTELPELNADVLVSFNLSSNSWVDKTGNERWSTSVMVYAIKPGAEANPQQYMQPQQQYDNTIMQPAPQPMNVPQGPTYQAPAPAPTNDLPF